MKYLVTYASKYGSTKKYAQWIAEALHCDIRESRTVDAALLKQYDVLIHGGGLYAGSLSGIRVITKNYPLLADKHVVLFSCGLFDPSDPENIKTIKAGLARILTPDMQTHIQQFHLRGGIDYPRLSLLHRIMMAGLRKFLLDKGYENLRDEDKLLIDTYGKQLDFIQKDSIAPIVAFVEAL